MGGDGGDRHRHPPRQPHVIVRRLIREFDGVVRRALGVFEFADDPACLVRLRLTPLRHPRRLRDGVLPAGSPVLEFHWRNEHCAAWPAAGPDAQWATRTVRRLQHSLGLLAYAVRTTPRLGVVVAIGGPTTLLTDQPSYALLERLGFPVPSGGAPRRPGVGLQPAGIARAEIDPFPARRDLDANGGSARPLPSGHTPSPP